MSVLVKDLFPETLIVKVVDGQPMTSSVQIAEHFNKNHKDVLRIINSVLVRTKNPEHRRNFAPMSDRDERNRRRNFYLLTEKGFQFVVSGFTGATADEWKWKFLDEFESLRAELQAATARYAAALDLLHPNLRPVVEGTQQGQKRVAIATPLGKSCAAVTYHRRKARRLGLLADKGAAA